MDRWRGCVALVTGASSGIGAAVCRRLVVEGMTVVGAARNTAPILALAGELDEHPGSLTAIQCDITKDDQVLGLFSEIKRKFGGVDVCINSAGMSHQRSLLEGRSEEWREMLDTNVVGLCLCTREAVASMRQRGQDHGHIIHISSLGGHQVSPRPHVHFYCATKFAVRALTEGLRNELRGANSRIRVTSISPGVVETGFAPRMFQDEAKGRELYRQQECLQSEDVADSVVHVLAAPPRVQIHDIVMRATNQVI